MKSTRNLCLFCSVLFSPVMCTCFPAQRSVHTCFPISTRVLRISFHHVHRLLACLLACLLGSNTALLAVRPTWGLSGADAGNHGTGRSEGDSRSDTAGLSGGVSSGVSRWFALDGGVGFQTHGVDDTLAGHSLVNPTCGGGSEWVGRGQCEARDIGRGRSTLEKTLEPVRVKKLYCK